MLKRVSPCHLRCILACAEKLGRYDLRRNPKQPREGFTLPAVDMVTVAPIPYDVLKEGVVQ